MTRSRVHDFNAPSGWNAMLPPRRPNPQAAGRHRVKYAVVGAGYTGAAAARRLHELDPSADIMLLDAGVVGEGSSGRNSGFTRPLEFPMELTRANAGRVQKIAPFLQEGFYWLKDIVERHGIDCGLVRAGVIRGAATDLGESRIRTASAVLDELGYENQILGREELVDRVATSYYRCGLLVSDSYLLQPAALIRGLVDSLPKAIAVHERSQVKKLSRRGNWHLELDGATVEAERVVLATNAYVKHFGYLVDRTVATYTYAALTEAMAPEDAGRTGSMTHWGILPPHKMGTTCRRFGRDRLMVRSLASYEGELSPSAVRAGLTRIYQARWPHLAHVKLEHVWGGATAFTMNGAPWWGKFDEGLYSAGGCNGAGITKGTLLGKRLAELMTGHGEHAGLTEAFGTPSWIAPEPFRRIGYHVIARKERKMAGAER
ncbi:NAD(P)/FAD-dependent oxidoreductase [Stella sp.]|uniref:NAD(P)/FAD-dependent oxidoreductase n=1 Tax=Stella sp. TaxID=2912054 RepID=UPI0035AD8109